MNKQHFTPGPWTYIEHTAIDGNNYIQILSGSWDIAHNKFSARDWEEERANARLIAAATKMYAAMEAAIECGLIPRATAKHGGASSYSRQVQVADQFRDALAQAKGENVE